MSDPAQPDSLKALVEAGPGWHYANGAPVAFWAVVDNTHSHRSTGDDRPLRVHAFVLNQSGQLEDVGWEGPFQGPARPERPNPAS
jgi:hypothetical protein